MRYKVNGRWIDYKVSGPKSWGREEVLLDNAIDLTRNTPWHNAGYTVEKLFPLELYSLFERNSRQLLIDCWRKAGFSCPDDFPLDQYHHLVQNFEEHLAAVNETKLLTTDRFPVSIRGIEKRISEICGVPLIARNPFDGLEVFHFRVIRPSSGDNNPLHRDVWLEDYDSCINLYIPIAGSDLNSSLIVLPESHLWPESRIERSVEGALIRNVRFNVPGVTNIIGDYSFVRPNPGLNEVLVFSPYLVHGGSSNLNELTTRISIELRLWKSH